jgi:hypothetical protein
MPASINIELRGDVLRKIFAAICLLLVFVPCQVLGEDALPEGPGKTIVFKKCQACHGLDLVRNERGSRENWAGILDEMVNNGLVINEKDKNLVLEYLSSHLGPGQKK